MFQVRVIEGKDCFRTTIIVDTSNAVDAEAEAIDYINRNTPAELRGQITILKVEKLVGDKTFRL